MAAAMDKPGGKPTTSSNRNTPDQEQPLTTLPTCAGEAQPHQDSPAVSNADGMQGTGEFPHQAQPDPGTKAVSSGNKNEGELKKQPDQSNAHGMTTSPANEGTQAMKEEVSHAQPPQATEAALTGTKDEGELEKQPDQPEPHQTTTPPMEDATQVMKEENSHAQPPRATEAVQHSNEKKEEGQATPPAQPTDHSMLVVPVEDLAAHRKRVEQQWREDWLQRENKKSTERLEAVMFGIEASLSAAQHFVMAMPYRKVPMAQTYDGKEFDPNPLGSLDPAEVSQILAALKNDTSCQLGALYREVTGRESGLYDIPAELISKAVTREDGESYSDKVRLQYRAEFSKDPEMKNMGTAMDRNLGPPPLRRLAAQPGPVQSGREDSVKPSIKAGPGTEVQGAAIVITGGGSVMPVKKPRTKKKRDPTTKQNYRESMKNNVTIILEATSTDILRTHRTLMGRTLWGAKGFVWPEVCKTSTDVEPDVWTWMSQKLARYCPAEHGSGWLVLVSGDISNCHECDHQNLLPVDIYLPPQSRFNILRRDHGVNEKALLFLTANGSLLPQPNHIEGLRNLSITFWKYGEVFRRGTLPVPKEVQDAVSQGRIDELFRKDKNASPVDRYLLKPKAGPKMNKRKLESKIKPALAKFDKSGSTSGLKDFHFDRLNHFWDMTAFSEKQLKAAITNMIARIESLQESKHLPVKKFDITLHWFVRQDVVEMISSKTLDSLLIELTGQGDPLSQPKELKKQVHDPGLAYVDLTKSDLSITGRKRKASDEAPKPQPRKRKPKGAKEEEQGENATMDSNGLLIEYDPEAEEGGNN